MTATTLVLNPGDTLTVSVGTVAPTPPPPPPPVSTGPVVKSVNGVLVDGAGKLLRFKGVNVSAMEYAYIQQWAKGFLNDPFCGQAGNVSVAAMLNLMKSWNINAIRIPVNEASILGVTTYDFNGAARNPDPAGNYMAQLKVVLDALYAAGMYGIVDMHWTSTKLAITGQPGLVPISPMGQAPAPSTDTTLPAWTILCALIKQYTNLIADGFNEYMASSYGEPPGTTDHWKFWRDGCTMAKFDNNSTGGSNYDVMQPWPNCGMQAVLSTIRAAGFTGPVILGGINWAGDDSQWLQYMPVDPLGQLGVSMHIYPAYGTKYGTAAYNTMPTARFDNLKAIQAAGHFVVLGEVGGHDVAGTPNEPFTQGVLDEALANGWHVFAWAWNTWANGDNVLIKDGAGTPTDGFGKVFMAHA
jgi:endoglucanase